MALTERLKYPAHGFSLARSKLLTYSALPGEPGKPVLRIFSAEGKAELHVVIAESTTPAHQREGTLEAAEQLRARMKQGKMAPLEDCWRPDKRASFQVTLTSALRDGLVVTVAGQGQTYVLMSTFPARRHTQTVKELLEVQLGLLLL